MTPPLPAALADFARDRFAALGEAGLPPPDDATRALLQPVLLASDYAFERLRRQPALAATLRAPPPRLDPGNEDPGLALRRFRHRHSLAILVDDVLGTASLEHTLARSSWLAEHCIAAALAAAEAPLIERHGAPRRRDGRPQRLLVLALGKLGGAELNFSSDIDLVFAFAEGGSTDGPRPLEHQAYFERVGQRLIQLLGEVGAEGFGFRVDMRLRPFGAAGRLALSFPAMEQYFQSEGRDWERYAWIKARAVAGTAADGDELLAALRPFVYRRYLDYTAFEGMREMKALIEAEVQRRDLADHLKLGPGGIREIEFIVQLQQLIRGGREPALRCHGLLPALAALVAGGHLRSAAAQRLEQAYRFLRRLENRLQMLRDEQVHALPDDELTRARLAFGLGLDDWGALREALDRHRDTVREEFARVFEARRQRPAGDHAAFADYWRRIERDADAALLAAAGAPLPEALHELLHAFAHGPGVQALAPAARARLDRVLPALLAASAGSHQPAVTLRRLLQLLHAVLRRSSYLALLDEQPVALQRLVEVMAGSALLADRLAAHPLLLDDLLDPRAEPAIGDRDAFRAEIDAALAGAAAGDAEAALIALAETRQSIAFRIGQAALFGRQPAAASARQLAALADTVLAALLPIAVSELERAHGRLPGGAAGVAVIGYGSLGGEELGFGSDLDLVFLFDDAIDGDSDGPRPIDATRYRLRVVQKLLALLSTLTPAGRLYEVDLRLRPDGAKGLLLTGLRSFDDYQRSRAWTWEHQALVRARHVAGDPALGARFDAVRREVLARPRDPAALRRDVAGMRQRMRAELDRSDASSFDLKQGRGGLVDLEFLLQARVLELAGAHPHLLDGGRTPALLAALPEADALDAARSTELAAAHETLLARALACSLDGRSRRVAEDATIAAARRAIIAAWEAAGLDAAAVAAPAGSSPHGSATDD
jgi:[glutamine synthetase] adenylyltransferase / [glutamine synthetase]-adenylyl-L-tyrosine phosphorylase